MFEVANTRQVIARAPLEGSSLEGLPLARGRPRGAPSRNSLAELPRETTSAFLKKGERDGGGAASHKSEGSGGPLGLPAARSARRR